MRPSGLTRNTVDPVTAGLIALGSLTFTGTPAALGQSVTPQVNLGAMKAGKDGYIAPVKGGGLAHLTLVPDLQEATGGERGSLRRRGHDFHSRRQGSNPGRPVRA